MNASKNNDLSDQARKDALRAMLLRLISDGQLTDEELRLLIRTRNALDLSPEEVRSLRAEIYQAALQRAQQDGHIGGREAELLDRIVQFLNGGAWLTEHFE
ncbi:hypothetical protein DEDE109153_15200 [Deinococcus deserti]|uniref:Co-chaperone DjlA N-terminal domain-containing protein n=1 Tax=Deinococcus deserti (strain DSM 17065 / CIP 109153 / LMG 22923 / VCD115) TaxID=546414 RepID=C1D210_DEIDV|nr:hypothetical protein [Deinococcus deserti]ACO47449.1 Hypothetical protein Deide_1p00490 [Deinococcus deserti VCD115]